MSKSIGITLLGYGTVGGGVATMLTTQAELLRRRTGLSFQIRHTVVRDLNRKREFPSGSSISNDLRGAIDAPDADIVVELIGGTGMAKAAVEHALSLGKPVVTANKSLLAAHGAELFALARSHNTCIAFEASCGGGIPIIDALTKGLIANRIDALVGIVNGTCNVILTQMTRSGWTYEHALEAAQKAGFAEADPTLDVCGRDAAQKLALLASLAFDVSILEKQIHIEGVENVQAADINFAGELGYVIKLLAIAERAGDGQIALRVHPTLVHKTDVLAEVSGAFNAISVYGHALGHALFYGRGAGQMPTASAVVSDIVSVAIGTAQLAFKQLTIFPDTTPAASVLPVEKLRSRYYLRLSARDVPGVLADVTDVLGRHQISVSAVRQHEPDDVGEFVPVIITTHQACEGSLRTALKEIDTLNTIAPPSVCLRIVEQPREFGE
jgi:homoserine dehydrogenase